MKKVFALLLFGLIILSTHAQNKTKAGEIADPNAPVFAFTAETIDYGKISHNSDGLRIFEFKNTGKSPLVIDKITSSCGCTIPKKPAEPIAPGASGKIEVKYATNRVGGFSKTITIYSNASEKVKRIRIKGIVSNPEVLVPNRKKKPSTSS